jgi:hypothetical protein
VRRISLFLITALLLPAMGCGGSDRRAEIRGTVRLDGKPLATGTISFTPTDANPGPSSGGAIVDGEYLVPQSQGATIGLNKVSIRSTQPTGRKTMLRPGEMIDEWKQIIPPKYNDLSEIVSIVEPGKNRLDFDLKSK